MGELNHQLIQNHMSTHVQHMFPLLLRFCAGIYGRRGGEPRWFKPDMYINRYSYVILHHITRDDVCGASLRERHTSHIMIQYLRNSLIT